VKREAFRQLQYLTVVGADEQGLGPHYRAVKLLPIRFGEHLSMRCRKSEGGVHSSQAGAQVRPDGDALHRNVYRHAGVVGPQRCPIPRSKI